MNEEKKISEEIKQDEKKYLERQFKRIMENLSTAELIVEHWLETINDKEYEELYVLISDSRNRLEGIKHYQKEGMIMKDEPKPEEEKKYPKIDSDIMSSIRTYM